MEFDCINDAVVALNTLYPHLNYPSSMPNGDEYNRYRIRNNGKLEFLTSEDDFYPYEWIASVYNRVWENG